MSAAEAVLDGVLLRPGIKEADIALLEDMVKDCILEVKDAINYREEEEIPQGLYGTVKELVCRKYNQDGIQGIQSESQSSGGSTTYLQDIPVTMKRQIYKYRRLRR